MSWQDDSDDTVACPCCGQEMYEDAVRCPHCGSYPSTEDTPARRSPWLIAGALICLAAVLGWILQLW